MNVGTIPDLSSEEPPLYDEPRLGLFFELATSAALAAIATMQAEVRRLGFVPPNIHYPALTEFPGGMPNVEHSTADVPHYLSLLRFTDPEDDSDARPDVREIAALQPLVRAVLEDGELRRRLGLAPDDPELEDINLEFTATSARSIPLAMAERWLLEHGPEGTSDSEQLLSTYLRLEAPLVLDELPFDAVMPIVATPFEVEAADFGDGIFLMRIPNAFQLARVPGFSTLSTAEDCLVSAATHAVVVADRVAPNAGRWFHPLTDIGGYPIEAMQLALASLRASTTSTMGVAQIYARPRGWAHNYISNLPPVINGPHVGWYPRHFIDQSRWVNPDDPIGAGEIAAAAAVSTGLSQSHARVRLAARKLNDAVLRDSQEDVILDACTGLEALLAGDSLELTYKLQVRAGAVLRFHPNLHTHPQIIAELVRAIYSARSKIIHGTGQPAKPIPLGDDEYPTYAVAIMLLRWVLFVVAMAHELRTGKQPGKPLDTLIFAGINELGAKPGEEDDEPVEGTNPTTSS